MAGNDAFNLVRERGWRRGFRNMIELELSGWFRTKRWWVQCLIWVGVVGFYLMIATIATTGPKDLHTALILYSVFGGVFPAIAVIILMQGVLVGEKNRGTAAWLLSKPVSHTAYIISKLVAGVVGVAVTMVLVPGILAYAMLSYGNNGLLPPFTFLLGLGVFLLFMLFFLSLTLMLGAFFNTRGPVIGIALAVMAIQNFGWMVKPLAFIFPWSMIIPGNTAADATSMSMGLFMGQLSGNWLQPVIVIVEVVLFTAIAIWRFKKEDL